MRQRRLKITRRHLVLLLVALSGLVLAASAPAQVFTTLHHFTALANSTNVDGAAPAAGLVLFGNTLYGTAKAGGTNGQGTVFKLNNDGSGFTTLYHFTGGSGGANPQGDMVLLDNTLYGTTYTSGSVHAGTVFAVTTDGLQFTPLHSFGSGDGGYPMAGLLAAGGALYGSATYGALGSGTLFKVDTNGGFQVVHTFSSLDMYGRNIDGADPQCLPLIDPNGTVYGTASQGGGTGQGTLFRMDPGGTGWSLPFDFYGIGEYPQAGVVLSGNTLYGTSSGPPYGSGGTVFAVNTDGSNPTTLHGFSGGSDGGKPLAPLILSGNTLYGTTAAGGDSGNGTVFRINTDGSGFATLYSFSALSGPANTNSDGATPQADRVLRGNTLYGSTSAGGASGNGTLFSLLVPVTRLTITLAGSNVVLLWPTNFVGVHLQSSTNFLPATTWTNVTPFPLLVNGQYTVTNPLGPARQFYRLSQ